MSIFDNGLEGEYYVHNWGWMVKALKDNIRSVEEIDKILAEYETNISTQIKNEIQQNIENGSFRDEIGKWIENFNKLFINVKDFGAKGDGITNDTDSFNKAILSMTEGDVLVIPSGTYIVNAMRFNEKRHITIIGNGTLKLADAVNDFVIMFESSSVQIIGITIDGNKQKNQLSSITGNHGIMLYNSNDCYIKDCTILNALNSGIECRNVENVNIFNNFIEMCSDAMRFVGENKNARIYHNILKNNNDGIFVYSEDKNTSYFFTIVSNTIEGNTNTTFDKLNASAITLDRCPYSVISKNRIQNCAMRGIFLFINNHDCIISNNEMHNVGYSLGDGLQGAAIDTDRATDCIIESNIIKKCASSGIWIVGCKNCIYTKNLIIDPADRFDSVSPQYQYNMIGILLGIESDGITNDDNSLTDNIIIDSRTSNKMQYCISESGTNKTLYQNNLFAGNIFKTKGALLNIIGSDTVYGNVHESYRQAFTTNTLSLSIVPPTIENVIVNNQYTTYIVNAQYSNKTVTLPEPKDGRLVIIKRWDNSETTVTVNTQGNMYNIDKDLKTIEIPKGYNSITFQALGMSWIIINKSFS